MRFVLLGILLLLLGADGTMSRTIDGGALTPIKVRDNGDGTFSHARSIEVIAVSADPHAAATWHDQTIGADNAIAVATKAAVAGSSHYVTGIVAQCESGTTLEVVRLIQTDPNAVVSVMIQVASPSSAVGPVQMDFAKPVRATIGNSVSVDISACGASTAGWLTIMGYTAVP